MEGTKGDRGDSGQKGAKGHRGLVGLQGKIFIVLLKSHLKSLKFDIFKNQV